MNCELEVPVTTEFLELQASLPTREGFEELLGGFDSVRRGYFLGTTSPSDLISSEFCACAVTLTPTSNSIKKSFVQFVKHRPLLFYGLARVRFITVLDARVL